MNFKMNSSSFMTLLIVSISVVAAALVITVCIYFATPETPAVETVNEDIEALYEETEPVPEDTAGTETEELPVSATASADNTSEVTFDSEDVTEAPVSTPETVAFSDVTTTTEAPSETTEAFRTTANTTAAVQMNGNDFYDPDYFAEDLFIGDSIYTGLYLYEYFSKDRVFAKIGLNPHSVHTAEISGYTAVSKAAALSPKHIFIMLGTNGIAFMDAGYMADQMKLLIAELKAASPSSSIYVLSIPPVTLTHDLEGAETNASIMIYNDLLKKICEDNGEGADAVFLDLNSQMSDDNGYLSSIYAEADGLHFLGTAYRHMLSYLQKATE